MRKLLPILVSGLACGMLAGCSGPRVEPLMPTPLLYSQLGVGPMDGVAEEERWKSLRIYYATTRERLQDRQRIDYGNKEANALSLGMALINFGDSEVGWSELNEASKVTDRDGEWLLSIAGLMELGGLDFTVDPPKVEESTAWLVADINRVLEDSRSGEILIYVHGAKVNFYNACAFTAQMTHFMGRDLVPLAFSWPTRQRITAYVFGGDRQRGKRSAQSLSVLLQILADHTEAKRIHVICWSAGGRVVARAVKNLRERHAEMTDEELAERFRLGTVYFAAADVPREDFLDALPSLNALSERVVVTTSSKDDALLSARVFMGGGPRIGQLTQEMSAEDRAIAEAANRLEVVDVSLGTQERGFDITGHRYWFNHPWASTDMILAAWGLDPVDRGLVNGGHPLLWGIPSDFPDRITPHMMERFQKGGRANPGRSIRDSIP